MRTPIFSKYFFSGLSGIALVTTAVACVTSTETAGEEAIESQTNGLGFTAKKPQFPNCGGSTTDATPVLLTWNFSGSKAFSGGAPLRLDNKTDAAQRVLVTVRLKGATGTTEFALDEIALAAGKSQNITIETTAIDHLTAVAHTPVTAVVFAEVDGQVVWAEQRSLHRLSGSTKYLWYPPSEVAMHTRTIVGELLNAYGVQPEDPEADLLGTMQFVAGAGKHQLSSSKWKEATAIEFDAPVTPNYNGPIAQGGPSGPNGEGSPPSESQTICFELNTDYSPGGVTFANTASNKPAKGAKVWISVPYVGTFFGGVSRSNGCVNIPALPEGYPFFMGMYFESHVGAGDNRDIRIRAFDRPGSSWSMANFNGDPYDVPRNAYFMLSSGAGTVTDLVTHPNNWRMANMLAVGSEVMAYYDQAVSDGSAFTHTVDFEVDGCYWGPTVSCAWDNNGHITSHDNGPRKAELIGHEFGHIVESLYMNAHLTANYDIDDATPGCFGYGEAHALNSKEHQSGSAKEGLVSALGARALSSTSDWRYYKSIDDSDGNYYNQIIDLEDAGDFQYLNNTCECLPGDCTSVFGVESDWIRFYWEWWDSSGIPISTFFSRHQAAAAGAGLGDVYQRLRLQMPAGPERTFFVERAQAHGIDGIP